MSNIILMSALVLTLATSEFTNVVADESTVEQIIEVATDTDATTDDSSIVDDVVDVVEDVVLTPEELAILDYIKDKADGFITDKDSFDVATTEEQERNMYKLGTTWIGFGLFFSFSGWIMNIFSFWTRRQGKGE